MIPQINITGVSKDKRKDYYKVETDNGSFLISESLIVKYSILKGREFTEDAFNEILNEVLREKYFLKVLNYISYRMRSEKEIRDYLLEKEASLEVVDYTVEKLNSLGYLDDKYLAECLLKEHINKQKGPHALMNKLKLRGISEVINKKVVDMYTNEIQEEIIDNIASKFLDNNKNLPVKKQKQKLYTKLLYNGFDSNVVNSKINAFNYDDESDEDLKKEIEKLVLKYQDNLINETKKKIVNKLILKGYDYKKIKEFFDEIISEIYD